MDTTSKLVRENAQLKATLLRRGKLPEDISGGGATEREKLMGKVALQCRVAALEILKLNLERGASPEVGLFQKFLHCERRRDEGCN